jgi:hypothetical protein
MTRTLASLALLASLSLGCTGITGGGSTEICAQAASHLEQCTGRKAPPTAASCDPVRAQEILAKDCAGRSAQAWYDDLCAFGFIDCNGFGGWNDPGNGTGNGTGTGSCAGQCNSQNDMGGCYCNADCVQLGDCCADYTTACGGAANPNPVNPGTGTGSCVGQCNSQNDMGGCYCNADCVQFGDCCADYTTACGGAANPNPVTPGTGTGTCAGNCNGGDMGGCYCNPDCLQFGDCCADYATSCP